MPAYDAAHSTPPAPFALATIRHPDSRKSVVDVPMLLDTGADATLLPRAVVEALGLPTQERDDIRLVAFDGTTTNTTADRTHLLFEGFTFRGDFLLMDDNYGIIGRDILNLLSLHLDGPNLFWQINPAPVIG
jgi:predicted aspartyl protease